MSSRLPPPAVAHQEAGRHVVVDGVRIFVREAGSGHPLLLMHGVPASSFLYRKMLPLLAARGFRAIAFDLPGLGLSAKPDDFAYDWHSLADWVGRIVAALDIAPVHLVVHDIGGPIALEWAIANKGAVKTITILNTILDVGRFRPPFPMWTYRVPVLRQIVVRTQNPVMFAPIMYRLGIKHRASMSFQDIAAYLALLACNGGRQSFLKIMAGFDLTEAHTRFLREGLLALDAPMQMIWGRHEIAIPRYQADYIQETFPLRHVHWVDGRHFIQEDQAEPCAERIADFCQGARAEPVP